MLFLKRLSAFFISISCLASVIYFVEPPSSWPQASLFQILAFFIPLLFTLTFLLNLFLRYLPYAFISSLGCVVLIALYSTNLFNLFSVPLTLALTLIAIRIFPKIYLPRFRLTRNTKIPKLSKLGKSKR